MSIKLLLSVFLASAAILGAVAAILAYVRRPHLFEPGSESDDYAYLWEDDYD